jgi:hypothetical protein
VSVDASKNPTGPILPGTVSQHLYFAPSGGAPGGNWAAYNRCGSAPAHSMSVKITYTYQFATPLGSLITGLGGSLFSNGQITMTDQTAMALEPPTP